MYTVTVWTAWNTSATFHVPRLRELTVMDFKSFVLLARPSPEDGSRVTRRLRPLCWDNCIRPLLWGRGEKLVIGLGPWYSHTDWRGRLTMLCDSYKDGSGEWLLSALKKSKIHEKTWQETLESDLHVFLLGMERPTRISHSRDVLGSMWRESRKKERYLCGPRLEAQLIGRAEAAVEGCRPGWFSKEHGVEILLRFLKTQCAKLALPDIGSHLQGFFLMLKRKKYEPVGVQDSEMSTPRSEEQLRDCDVLRSRKTWTGNGQMLYHRGIWIGRGMTVIQRKWWNGALFQRPTQTHGQVGTGVSGRKPATTTGMEHRRSASKISKKYHSCFSSLFSRGSSCRRKDWRPEGEREKHESGGNGEQISTGLGGTSDEDTVSRRRDSKSRWQNSQVRQQFSGGCSQWRRRRPDDRRYGSAWEQRRWSRCVGHSSRKEVQALTSLATNNRTLREARAKQHQVRMARGFLNNSHIATATTGDRNGSVSFAEDHTGPHSVQRSEEGQPKGSEMRQHTWHTENSLCPCTPKRACSHKERWRRRGRWLIVVLLDAWALGKIWTGWHAWANSYTDHLGFRWIVRGRPGTPLQMERDHRANVKSHFRLTLEERWVIARSPIWMQQEYPFSCLYRASPRWGPLWASAQVPPFFRNLTD